MVVTANAKDDDRKRTPRNQNPAFTQAVTECRKTAGIPEQDKNTREKTKISQSQRETFRNCMTAKGYEKPQRVKQDPARQQAATECRNNAGITARTSKEKSKVTQSQREAFTSCMKAKGFETKQRRAK
jgi:hypothetical protein